MALQIALDLKFLLRETIIYLNGVLVPLSSPGSR